MSLSKDKAMMTVNGITMSVKGFSALPGNIPIQNSAQQPTVPPAPAPTADNANIGQFFPIPSIRAPVIPKQVISGAVLAW